MVRSDPEEERLRKCRKQDNVSVKKNKQRKLTQEKVDSINRKRDMLEGDGLSWEAPHERLVLDESGRIMFVDTRLRFWNAG